MTDFELQPHHLEEWSQNGYIIVRGLLKSEEIQAIRIALANDQGVMKNAFGVPDGSGRVSRLCLWNHPGNDITGMIARSEKIVNTMEKLLGGEVYHYHTKLMMKEAYTGGSFVWHQDYGYWYKNGCLFPQMATVFIALDPSMKSNGCLQVLKGSHNLGRIDHEFIGGQTGANLQRVREAEKIFEKVFVELEPGDALFFHCNLLHSSSQNDSDQSRYAFLIAYNRATNNPTLPHHHPFYTPLQKVPNAAIAACQVIDTVGKDFLDPDKDNTIKSSGYH
eukprot:TRINITY_DN2112_c0_g1_i1.p1 TRINITY_DN2112_c0_g1~~TRINITY_DN2112_c0_g1_i1.p1  ORF type:complete len:298 (+),score=30.98 TRINITY_DN2112_c0_g1_i1:64-894(+)